MGVHVQSRAAAHLQPTQKYKLRKKQVCSIKRQSSTKASNSIKLDQNQNQSLLHSSLSSIFSRLLADIQKHNFTTPRSHTELVTTVRRKLQNVVNPGVSQDSRTP